MVTFLLTLLVIFAFVYYFNRTVKRVLVKPVAKSGLVGPELLAEKTRLEVLKEKVRPYSWGVVSGAVMWPVISWVIG